MQLYLFDTSPIEERRDWVQMPPTQWLETTWGYDKQQFSVPDGLRVQTGALLIAHESEMDQHENQIRTLENSRVFCLIVSGGPGSHIGLGRIGTTGYVYRRRAIVAYGKGAIDRNFKRCLLRFWKDLGARGVPTWRLIEPDPCPENAVAAYLLMIAKDYHGITLGEESYHRIDEASGTAFWTCVREDLSDLEQTIEGLPESWHDFAARDLAQPKAALRAIFQECST
jgi:hypothetical protein